MVGNIVASYSYLAPSCVKQQLQSLVSLASNPVLNKGFCGNELRA